MWEEANPNTSRRYQAVQCIERAGDVELWEARGVVAGAMERVWIKRLLPSVGATPARRAMLHQELADAMALEHPNIIRVVEVIEEPTCVAVVMEHLEGEHLQEQLRHRLTTAGSPMPWEQVLSIGLEVSKGLQYAHGFCDLHGEHKPIYHGEISPTRIWLTPEGAVKILDFGLAGTSDFATVADSSAAVAYMAPEQVKGESCDGRSDLFCLGSVMYTLLTGVAPFRAKGTSKLLLAIVNEEPEPPTSFCPDLPEEVGLVLSWLLAKSPHDRPRDARELIQHLRSLGVPEPTPDPAALEFDTHESPPALHEPEPTPFEALHESEALLSSEGVRGMEPQDVATMTATFLRDDRVRSLPPKAVLPPPSDPSLEFEPKGFDPLETAALSHLQPAPPPQLLPPPTRTPYIHAHDETLMLGNRPISPPQEPYSQEWSRSPGALFEEPILEPEPGPDDGLPEPEARELALDDGQPLPLLAGSDALFRSPLERALTPKTKRRIALMAGLLGVCLLGWFWGQLPQPVELVLHSQPHAIVRTDDGKSLGTTPVRIRGKAGQRIALRLIRTGYYTKAISIFLSSKTTQRRAYTLEPKSPRRKP